MKKISDCRKGKVLAYKFRKDKNSSLAAGLLIDFGLSEFGLKGKNILFTYGKNGKPSIKEYPNIHFNVSHSGNFAIAAFAGKETGCDIEKTEKNIDLKISEMFFCPSECEYINSFDDKDSKINAFYRLWVLKESFIKATGCGLSVPLDSFCINIGEKITVEQQENKNEYFFREHNIDGYKIAFCSEEKDFTDRLLYVDVVKDILR
ncbi:MAG: 4'-phosphopantetheinyl transferase superfamily protein [Clostridia bacterium]|nr:4'-phosphopantetheinyl transferase superfamily protein [Clostridia bacterium]